MLTSTGLKKHGSLILLELSEPEELALMSVLHELEAGMFIALSRSQLDLVSQLIAALPKRGAKEQP